MSVCNPRILAFSMLNNTGTRRFLITSDFHQNLHTSGQVGSLGLIEIPTIFRLLLLNGTYFDSLYNEIPAQW